MKKYLFNVFLLMILIISLVNVSAFTTTNGDVVTLDEYDVNYHVKDKTFFDSIRFSLFSIGTYKGNDYSTTFYPDDRLIIKGDYTTWNVNCNKASVLQELYYKGIYYKAWRSTSYFSVSGNKRVIGTDANFIIPNKLGNWEVVGYVACFDNGEYKISNAYVSSFTVIEESNSCIEGYENEKYCCSASGVTGQEDVCQIYRYSDCTSEVKIVESCDSGLCLYGSCEERKCPNGYCDSGENYQSCPQDCDNPNSDTGNGAVLCGNGVCDINEGETSQNCRSDCSELDDNNDLDSTFNVSFIFIIIILIIGGSLYWWFKK